MKSWVPNPNVTFVGGVPFSQSWYIIKPPLALPEDLTVAKHELLLWVLLSEGRLKKLVLWSMELGEETNIVGRLSNALGVKQNRMLI